MIRNMINNGTAPAYIIDKLYSYGVPYDFVISYINENQPESPPFDNGKDERK
jgi:hypothetical protein